jgi:hypothetical protein
MTDAYSPQLPLDKRGTPKQGVYFPAKAALASSNKENASASSILLLTHDTTELEVTAAGQNVAGKWLTQATVDSSVAGTSVLTAAATANFDFMIPNNTMRRFVVPIATIANSASIQGVNRANGLYPAVAFVTFAGNGSVLTSQF